MKDTIRRILPVLIGGVMVLAGSDAVAQNGNGPLGQILNTYQNATSQWIDQFLNYARNLFVALAGIEFAWTAVILLLEQRELEGWVAAFIKKLMGVSFFYALLIYAPTWIPAIIDSFTQIGQNVGGTGKLTPEGILQAGISMAHQILMAASSITVVATAMGNLSWMLLLGAIAIVIIICYIAIAFQFIMAQVEGYIVISTGMLYLGFGGSRWTSSYAERFLGAAVSTGIRIMVIFLIIGLGQQLTNSTWIPAVAAMYPQVVVAHDYLGAVESAFVFTAGIIIFTALALRLPKVVSAVISGSPSFSGGDLAGGVGSILGGAAAVAGMIAAPEALAAKMAGGGAGAAEGAMSASTAAGLNSASSASSTIGSSAKDVSPPSSQGAIGAKPGQNPSATSPSSANSATTAPARSGSMAGPTAQPSPPSSPSSSGTGLGSKAGTSAAMNGSTPLASPPPLAESPASLDSASAPLASTSLDSASGNSSELNAMTSEANMQPPEQSGGNGTNALQNFFASARAASDGLSHAQGVFTSFENDGGGAPPHSPPPTEGSLRD